MTSRLPWTRNVGEGVVIVVSILLAFGIDAWWGVRGERRLEAEYVSRLQAELGARASDSPSLRQEPECGQCRDG